MSKSAAKRKADTPEEKPTKKQKISGSGATSAPSSAKIKVRGDALKWKAVALPGRLDDAEGFFGLEEIDDVEVVRDESNNHVMFQPKSVALVDVDEITQEFNDEWSGFEEETPSNDQKAEKSKKPEPKPKAKKSAKKSKSVTPPNRRMTRQARQRNRTTLTLT